MSGPLSVFLNKTEVEASQGFGLTPVLIGVSYRQETLISNEGSFSLAIGESARAAIEQNGIIDCTVEFWKDLGRYDISRISSDRSRVYLSCLSAGNAQELVGALENITAAFVQSGIVAYAERAYIPSVAINNNVGIADSVMVANLPGSITASSRVTLCSIASVKCEATLDGGRIKITPPAGIVIQRPLNAPISAKVRFRSRISETQIISLKDGESVPDALASDNCGGAGYAAAAMRKSGYSGPIVIASLASEDDLSQTVSDLAINSHGGYWLVPFFEPGGIHAFAKEAEAVVLGSYPLVEEKGILSTTRAWKVDNLLSGYGMFYGQSYGMGSE